MTIVLRDYQQEAVNCIAQALREHPWALCVAGTGAGKGVIQAEIARRVLEKHPSWRVLVLTHVSEILAQNNAMCERMGIDSGIFCAGLGRKDKTQCVIHASRDSLGRNPHAAGAFNLVIIDEVHLCSDDEDTRYRKLLDAISPRYVVGMTGTPYRTGGGHIYGRRKLFPGVAYSIPAKALVERGYLSRPVVPPPKAVVDTSGLKVASTGDFEAAAMERLVDSDAVIKASLDVWQEHALERRCTLFFCTSLEHARHVFEEFKRRFPAHAAAYLDGTTDKRVRAQLIEDARAGRYRAIFQVATMTTGTDIPVIDCIMWLRPTASAVLWVQGNGRGLRLAPAKTTCLVLDVVGNHDRFGSVLEPRIEEKTSSAKRVEFSDDELLAMGIDPAVMKGKAATKECPRCKATVHAAARKCDACGYLFIAFDRLHTEDSKPREVEVLEATMARASTNAGEACYVVSYRTKEKVYREWILDQRAWAKPIARQRLEQVRQGVTRIRLTPNPNKPLFPKIEVVACGSQTSSVSFSAGS